MHGLPVFPWMALLYGVHQIYFWQHWILLVLSQIWYSKMVSHLFSIFLDFHWGHMPSQVYCLIILEIVYFSIREFFFSQRLVNDLSILNVVFIAFEFIVYLLIFAYITWCKETQNFCVIKYFLCVQKLLFDGLFFRVSFLLFHLDLILECGMREVSDWWEILRGKQLFEMSF